MLRTVLLDDEPIILEELYSLLEDDERIEIVGSFSDPLTLLQELPALKPDCLFLDIEMPGISGIELAERLASAGMELEIVFVTAYNHYAAQAFDVNAIDYLLKPIRQERIRKAVDKLVSQAELKPVLERQRLKTSAVCRIQSFGAFEVSGEHKVKWTRSKSKELLAYLLQYEGKWLSKYKLCDEQWGDYEPERALAYLQTSLYALRKSLQQAGCRELRIEYAEDRYILQAGAADWDVRTFNAAYAQFLQSGSSAAAREALDSCRGEYLEGEDWPWSDLIRENYLRRYEQLMQHFA